MGLFSTLTVKKYIAFSEEEMKSLSIGILVMAFIVSYNDWGVDAFNFWLGLRNFFNAILIVTLAMLVHQIAQRMAGFSVGLKVEYKIWLYGLVVGVALAVVSSGRLWFLAPGGILVYHMAGHRLGSFRYGLNYWPIGLSGLSGPLANLFLAILLKLFLSLSPTNVLLQQALTFNIWFAILTMLPIPPLDGSHMFFSSRRMYLFTAAFVLGMALSLLFLGVFLSIMIGLIVGAIIFLLNAWYLDEGTKM